MRLKFIIGSLAGFVVLCGVLFFIKGYPLVLKKSKTDETVEKNFVDDGKEFNPLKGVNLEDGEWTVYLIIDKSDFGKLTPQLKPYKLWKTNSVSVLKEMQSAWNFKSIGGDMTTATSAVVIVHDGQIIFESALVLDKNMVGLQSESFGWAEPVHRSEFLRTLNGFTRVYSPIALI